MAVVSLLSTACRTVSRIEHLSVLAAMFMTWRVFSVCSGSSQAPSTSLVCLISVMGPFSIIEILVY